MLAADRAILEAYCRDSGRPLDVVKRWLRKLPDDATRKRALRNIEARNAQREIGIVGKDGFAATGIILPDATS